MKMMFWLVIFCLFLPVVFAVDDEIVVDMDGFLFGEDVLEPWSWRDLFGVQSFVPARNCLETSLNIVNLRYPTYTTWGMVLPEGRHYNYGAKCAVGERIVLMACTGNNFGDCYKLFRDEYLKESASDALRLSVECGGGDCYRQDWYLRAISDRYVGYVCEKCNGDFEPVPSPSVPVESCKLSGEKRCFDGDVWEYDSCGVKRSRVDSCGAGYECKAGECVKSCVAQAELKCFEGNVASFDSCGAFELVVQTCMFGCENGLCVSETGESKPLNPDVYIEPDVNIFHKYGLWFGAGFVVIVLLVGGVMVGKKKLAR